MYRIKFGNGYTLKKCVADGSAFRTTESVDIDLVKAGLRHVEIEHDPDGENDVAILSGTYEGMTLGYYSKRNGYTLLTLNARDEAEYERQKLRADVDYALMLGETQRTGGDE